MAYTTIDKPTDYFNTKLYAGNGGTQSISGVGFQPDWVWIKNRSGSDQHSIYDSVRGANKVLRSNSNASEGTQTDGLTAFDSDGFSVGASGSVNTSSNNFVSWNWLAGGTASSNSDGSITSSVSANTTAGFSILTYTGTGSSATVGHGLGAVPKMILFKKTSGAQGWGVYHAGVGNTGALALNTTDATDTTSNYFNNTSPTSSVFTVNGSYVGNGSSSGSYIHLGFKPALIITKRTDGISHWLMMDNKRDTFNVAKTLVVANESDSESDWGTGRNIDFLSNGFKARSTSTGLNISGSSYIFMAFAENPFVTSTGIPTTAR